VAIGGFLATLVLMFIGGHGIVAPTWLLKKLV